MTENNLIDYEALKTRLDRAREQRLAQAQKLRRLALSALKAAGVTCVEARYDGYGDSGGIAEIHIFPEGAVDLGCVRVAFDIGDVDRSGRTPREMTLKELLEWLFMDYVCLDFGGWEINDGGRGDICWEITADRIGIEHTSYYTESRHDSREY